MSLKYERSNTKQSIRIEGDPGFMFESELRLSWSSTLQGLCNNRFRRAIDNDAKIDLQPAFSSLVRAENGFCTEPISSLRMNSVHV
jgi:hypothetical protein